MNGRTALGILTSLVGALVVVTGLQGTNAAVERTAPTQQVTADPQQAINVNTSPVVAVDPRRPEVLVVAGRVDAPRLNCTLSVSTTGGEAWRPLDLPPAPGATNCFWPDIAFDGDGNLLVIYTPTSGPFNLPENLWLQRFTPELAPDGPPVLVSGPLTFEPRLAVDGGRVLVAWVQAPEARATKFLGFGPPPNPILLARSADGGRTFAPPVTVSEPGRLAVQPTLRAWGGGRVLVGALDLVDDRTTYESAHEGQPGPPPSGRWRVVAWTSADGGATFGPATTVGADVVPTQRVLIDLAPAPAFAVDPGRRPAVRGMGVGPRRGAVQVGRRRRLVVTAPAGGRGGGRPVPARGRGGPGRAGRRGVLRPQRGSRRRHGAGRHGLLRRRWPLIHHGHRSPSRRSTRSSARSRAPTSCSAATWPWPRRTTGPRPSGPTGAGATARTTSSTWSPAPSTCARASGARVPVVVGGVVLIALGGAATARSWPGRGAGRDRRPARHREAWPPPARRG